MYGFADRAGKAVVVADSGADLPRLAAVIERQRREVARLRAQAAADTVLAMAKGVLMEKYGISEQEAFRRIQKASMNNRKSMKDVAEAILLADELEGQ